MMAHIADEVRFNLAVSKYPAPTFERKAVAIAPTGDRLERKARCGLENGIVGARRGRFASVVDLYDKIGRDMPRARRAIVVSAQHRVGESLDRFAADGRCPTVEYELAIGEQLRKPAEIAIIDKESVSRDQICDCLLVTNVWHSLRSADSMYAAMFYDRVVTIANFL
jgi:hypothetical protein